MTTIDQNLTSKYKKMLELSNNSSFIISFLNYTIIAYPKIIK